MWKCKNILQGFVGDKGNSEDFCGEKPESFSCRTGVVRSSRSNLPLFFHRAECEHWAVRRHGFSSLPFLFLEWAFAGIVLLFFLASILITPLLVIDCQIVKSKRSGVVFVDFLLCCSLFSWKSHNPKWHEPNCASFERWRQKHNNCCGRSPFPNWPLTTTAGGVFQVHDSCRNMRWISPNFCASRLE